MDLNFNDYVIATNKSIYEGLVGIITDIDFDNTETENDTPDIYVNFVENPDKPLDLFYPELNGTSIEQVIMSEDEIKKVNLTEEEISAFNSLYQKELS